MDDDILLDIKKISKFFGTTQVLKDISIQIKSGRIHSFLGRNGAGKSTLVNIIAGVYPQTSGEVFFEGENVTLPWRKTYLSACCRSPSGEWWIGRR
ncbi:ATP-binding cassette domain-containing protein [Caproiciproducens sp. NJN-50]|uniref:ATP-binding cassette domain-containing protein n=1 Tax=Caproiciproducens sp. NJN-50 TaxID=2507162 RepID=UPI0013E8B206